MQLQTPNDPSPGDKQLPFGRYPTQTGTVTTKDQWNIALMEGAPERRMHLVSHIWNKLVKVLHRFVYVHHLSPLAFLNVSTSCRTVSGAEGCELRALDKKIR